MPVQAITADARISQVGRAPKAMPNSGTINTLRLVRKALRLDDMNSNPKACATYETSTNAPSSAPSFQVARGTLRTTGNMQTAAIMKRTADTSTPLSWAVATFSTGKVAPQTRVTNNSAQTWILTKRTYVVACIAAPTLTLLIRQGMRPALWGR